MSAPSNDVESHDDPTAIRKQIEETRDRIADTAEALAYKTDVPARLKDNVAERVDAVKGAIAGATSKLTQGVHDVSQTAKHNINGTASTLDDAKSTAGARFADASSTAQSKLHDATDSVRDNISGLGDAAQSKLSSTGKATKSVALDAKDLLEKNPLGLAIGSIAAGFLIGLALPVSDLERDKVGPLGERVKDQAKQAASEMVAQGKAVVTTAVHDALGTAKS